MTPKTKSPLKDKHLRYVAQSADEAIDDLLNEKLMFYWTAVVITGVLIAWEWYRYYHPYKTSPIGMSLLAAIACLFCMWRFIVHFRKLKNLKLGRNGERAVGQYLEEFRESGCRVYHDIVGDKFNVDHVVISPKGIYVIETKTYSKPSNGRANVTYDGQRILINGKEPFTDIIVQAKASTSHIKKIINDSTGKKFEPFPVVLFPGWFVQGNGNNQGKMWVLEPKAFRKFLDRQTVKLSLEDVKLASYHLSRHIRKSCV